MQKPFNVQIFATILNSACSLRIFTRWEWPASNPEPLPQKSWALGTNEPPHVPGPNGQLVTQLSSGGRPFFPPTTSPTKAAAQTT